MNWPGQDPLRAFEALVAPHRSRWETVEFRVFALREGDRLMNLITHAILRFPGECLVPTSAVELSRRLVALTHHESSAALGDLLAQLKAGAVRLGGGQVQYRTEPSRPPMFYLSKSRRGDAHGPDHHPAFGARPLLGLTASGPSFTEICGEARLQDAIWELRAAKVPYESVDDFQESFLGLRPSGWGGFGDSSIAVVTAPLGLRLAGQSVIIGDELRAEVSAHGTLPEIEVRVAVVARMADGVFRDSKRIEAAGWRPTPDGSAASVTWKLPGVDRATLLLTVGDEALDTLSITDPTRPSANIRLAAHATIDAQLRELSRLLKGEGKQDAHDFENAIGLLLHVCGFSVAQYGSGGPFRDGPDLVAFCGNPPIVMVVECTLRDIDSNSKLSKLHLRRQQVAAALPGKEILAAIFAPLAHAEIADHEKAEKLGIAVGSAEVIARLRDLAVGGASMRQVLEELGFEVS